MSTKQEGLPILDKVDPDEPVFVLRARDIIAPEIVREWAFRAQVEGSPIEKCDNARKIADDMEQWQIANRRKIAD